MLFRYSSQGSQEGWPEKLFVRNVENNLMRDANLMRTKWHRACFRLLCFFFSTITAFSEFCRQISDAFSAEKHWKSTIPVETKVAICTNAVLAKISYFILFGV